MLEGLRAGLYNRRKGWKFIGATTEHCPLTDWPYNFWSIAWEQSEGQVELRDPLYNQTKKLSVYSATHDGRPVKFAVCEFSNGIYGFYIPSSCA